MNVKQYTYCPQEDDCQDDDTYIIITHTDDPGEDDE